MNDNQQGQQNNDETEGSAKEAGDTTIDDEPTLEEQITPPEKDRQEGEAAEATREGDTDQKGGIPQPSANPAEYSAEEVNKKARRLKDVSVKGGPSPEEESREGPIHKKDREEQTSHLATLRTLERDAQKVLDEKDASAADIVLSEQAEKFKKESQEREKKALEKEDRETAQAQERARQKAHKGEEGEKKETKGRLDQDETLKEQIKKAKEAQKEKEEEKKQQKAEEKSEEERKKMIEKQKKAREQARKEAQKRREREKQRKKEKREKERQKREEKKKQEEKQKQTPETPKPQQKQAKQAPKPPTPEQKEAKQEPKQPTQQEKAAKQARKRAKQRKQTQTETQKTRSQKSSSSTKTVVGAIIAVLLLGGIGIAGYTLFSQADDTSQPTESGIKPTAFVNTEEVVEISTADKSDDAVVEELANLRTRDLDLNTFLNVSITSATTTKRGEEAQLITANEFFNIIDAGIPPILSHTLTGRLMLGYHGFDKNHFFLILPISSYKNAFAGMLRWEGRIENSLEPLLVPRSELLTATTTKTTDEAGESNASAERKQQRESILESFSERPFTDRVVQNRDTRILYLDNGAVRLVYTITPDKKLIITSSTETLKEIFNRRESRQFTQ